MKKIKKLKEISGIEKDWVEGEGNLTYATTDNMIILADGLDSVEDKLNELIDQVNHLSDQLEGKE